MWMTLKYKQLRGLCKDETRLKRSAHDKLASGPHGILTNRENAHVDTKLPRNSVYMCTLLINKGFHESEMTH